MIQTTATAKPIVYPDSDGELIAENNASPRMHLP